jgi:K+-sensing histidine kinase KdpD
MISRINSWLQVSHDLRTPLHGIQGMLETASHFKDLEEIDLKIKRAMNCSQILLGMINNLLDHFQIKRGSLRLRNQHYNFVQKLDEVVS